MCLTAYQTSKGFTQTGILICALRRCHWMSESINRQSKWAYQLKYITVSRHSCCGYCKLLACRAYLQSHRVELERQSPACRNPQDGRDMLRNNKCTLFTYVCKHKLYIWCKHACVRLTGVMCGAYLVTIVDAMIHQAVPAPWKITCRGNWYSLHQT